MIGASYETMNERARELVGDLAVIVGHDGTDALRVIVDCALAENPDVTLDELVEIVREARDDAESEVES